MYKFAHKYDDNYVFYFDPNGNKYVASGGNLAWRINNPGLVHSHSHFMGSHKAIGSYGKYAIFANPQYGEEALSEWLQSKKYHESSLYTIAQHYQPNDPDAYLEKLTLYTGISTHAKVKSLNAEEFGKLLRGIEKLCEFIAVGDEQFLLLPKISAKLENNRGKEDSYLIGYEVVLSKSAAIEWILSHRLDAVIVRRRNGTVYLRSRPSHCIWNIRMPEEVLPANEGEIDTLVRIVGEQRPHQCIWGFINGIKNSKEAALESATLISNAADGEAVFSMPNDSQAGGIIDGLACFVLKLCIDTPVVKLAVKFFKYLLMLSEQDSSRPPVIIFAHSQGAIISEHALEFLTPKERQQIHIFTFGGGSFIDTKKCHSDSHNYASAGDIIARVGSPNLQILALERYYGFKEGLTEKQIIHKLATNDAMLHLDTLSAQIFESYISQRIKYYEQQFIEIGNVTVLDAGSQWEHGFNNHCYQKIVITIIKKYRALQRSRDTSFPLIGNDIEVDLSMTAV